MKTRNMHLQSDKCRRFVLRTDYIFCVMHGNQMVKDINTYTIENINH